MQHPTDRSTLWAGLEDFRRISVWTCGGPELLRRRADGLVVERVVERTGLVVQQHPQALGGEVDRALARQKHDARWAAGFAEVALVGTDQELRVRRVAQHLGRRADKVVRG